LGHMGHVFAFFESNRWCNMRGGARFVKVLEFIDGEFPANIYSGRKNRRNKRRYPINCSK
jgi:hypothetical protein